MGNAFPLFFAVIAGFSHAFEADHLLAVSNIVSRRTKLSLALKDGIFWGLGHTSTIFLVGLLMIVGKLAIAAHTFHYFEATVGVMLVSLGMYRFLKVIRLSQSRSTEHLQDHSHNHRLAYSVGIVHGLAGSGALVVLVMTQLPSAGSAMLYLLVFGMGSVFGMLLAAWLFHLPFSKSISTHMALQIGLSILSSLLCIGFGARVIFENL